MSGSDERAKMNPFSAAMDMIGIPKPDQIIPMPADVAKAIGLPTPESVFGDMAGKVTGKISSRSF